MGRRRNKEDEEPEAPQRGLIRSFFGLLNTTFVLLVIVYVATRAMTYTAGFRNLIEEQILARYDIPLTIGKVQSNWRCDLELQNVGMTNSEARTSGVVRVDKVKLNWSLSDSLSERKFKLRRLDVTGCSITFVARDGSWEPAALTPMSAWLAKLLDVDLPAPAHTNQPATNTVSHVAADAKSASRLMETAFSVKDMGLSWTGATGELASVTGVQFDVTPVHVPGRDFRHCHLKLDSARAKDGSVVKNVDLEMFDTGDQQIVLGFKADRMKAPGP